MWILVLGVTEAGLFPGAIYVFSVYYRRHERSWRVAIFFGGAALSGAFGGQFLFNITVVIKFQKCIQVYLHMALERWMVLADDMDGDGNHIFFVDVQNLADVLQSGFSF